MAAERVRDATPDDLTAIVGIYNAAVATRMSVGELDPVTIESRAAWFEAHSPGLRPIWVLECPEVVGWISLQSFGPLESFSRTAEVSLFIAPSHQRMGYGTLLLSRMIDACPALGVATLIGTCFAHNEATRRLNVRLGFESWGRFPEVAMLDGVPADLVFMGRRIDSRGTHAPC